MKNINWIDIDKFIGTPSRNELNLLTKNRINMDLLIGVMHSQVSVVLHEFVMCFHLQKIVLDAF